MKKKLFLCILATAVFALAACQTTPEKPIVIGKNTELLVEKATESDSPNVSGTAPAETVTKEGGAGKAELMRKLGIPEQFTANESYSDGRLTLSADAEIIVPDANTMPVLRVEPGDFSQELADRLYSALIGDTPMYEQQEIYTKRQVQENIVEWQQILNNEGSAEESKRQAEKEISDLEGAYASAPETVPMIPAASEIKLQPEYDFTTGRKTSEYSGVNIAEKPGLNVGDGKIFQIKNNTKDGKITVVEDEFGATVTDTASQGARFIYINNSLYPNGDMGFPVETVTPQSYADRPETAGIFTYKQALEMAEDFLSRAGIEDMSVGSMTLKYVLPAKYTDMSSTMKPQEYEAFQDDIASGRYNGEISDVMIELELVRTVDGIPVTSGNISSYIGDAMYGKQWYYESFNMELCSRGICLVEWVSPHNITETVTEDATMRPFSDIEDVFYNMYRVKYDKNTADCKFEGNVDKVTLTLSRIMEQNNVGNGLFVPVWDFYGTMAVTYPGEETRVAPSREPLLTINGIDGSVIDRNQGY